MAVSRDDILSLARECIGTPFLNQGRTPGHGLDCAGVVLYPGNKLGLINFDYKGYGNQPIPKIMYKFLKENSTEISLRDIKPADVIWFKFTNDLQHLAIYTGRNIIHSVSRGPRKVVEHGYRFPWPQRAVKAFRYPGIE